MAKIPSNQIEKLIADHFNKDELKANRFYTVGKVPPLTILRMTLQFPSLNLAREEIFLFYDNNLGAINGGFVLTDSNIHFNKGYLSIDDVEKLFDEAGEMKLPLTSLKEEMKEKLHQFLLAIAAYDEESNMNIVRFGKSDKKKSENSGGGAAPKDKVSPEKAIEQDIVDDAYLQMLRHEGDVYVDLCKRLDKDKAFKDAIRKMANDSDIIVNDPNTKELFVQDIIRTYNMCTAVESVNSRRVQFALVYMYERLLGKGDMGDSIKLSRINDMLQNPNFPEKIKLLQDFKIFNVKGQFPNEMLLPVILSKLGHELFQEVSSHLYRFASIIVKADGKVTKEEEDILQKIVKLSQEPKKAIPNVTQVEVDENESLEDVFAELNELIGLRNIKDEIKTLINFLKIQKLREEKGLANSSRGLHMVFMGPPGTGKTTIARLISRIFKHLGILERGHLVETDRAGLVAGYIGQTALKVDEVVKAALDGVLFIDEAYALSRGGGDKRDFGSEAVETILKRMEDYRKRLVVIVAGYPNEMEDFIKSNPGFQSRFNRYYTFDHYKPQELLAIFKIFAKKADFQLSDDGEEKLMFIFEELYEKRNDSFGNARVARNLFGECVERQANRLVKIAPLTKDILMTITEEDIPPVKETVERILVFDPQKKNKSVNQSGQSPQMNEDTMKQLGQMMNMADKDTEYYDAKPVDDGSGDAPEKVEE
ncbi:MAG: AAA family ATPase [Chitinophagales bacterium]